MALIDSPRLALVACMLVLPSWHCVSADGDPPAPAVRQQSSPDLRSQVEAAARELSGGARIVKTAGGPVLLALGEVSLPEIEPPERAFAEASSVSIVLARAEAALFLAGVYESRVVSKQSSEEGDAVIERSFFREFTRASARMQLASGEVVALGRSDGDERVRAVVAWTTGSPVLEPLATDPSGLERVAKEVLRRKDVAAFELRRVQQKDGSAGLQVTLVLYPDESDSPAGAADRTATLSPAQLATRKTILSAFLDKELRGWLESGDIAVLQQSEFVSKSTLTKAKDGQQAVRSFAASEFSSETKLTWDSSLVPPSVLQKAVMAYAHSPQRSVCVAYIPLPAPEHKGK